MASRKVTVFGANSALGAAVAQRLAKDRNLNVEAVVSRGCGSEINDSSIKVHQCDLSNVDNIRNVLRGSAAVFVNTVPDFENPNFRVEDEICQGKNIADACTQEKIPHIVLVTNLHTTNIIGIAARHLVAKAEIESYMKSIGLSLTCIMVPFLYEELLDKLKPLHAGGPNHWLAIPMGITPLDMISAGDVGNIVYAILTNKQGHIDKTHSLCADKLCIAEMANILSMCLQPLQFRDKQVTVHQFSQMYQCKPWGQDYANMFDFFLRVDQRYNVDATKRLSSESITSFQEWVYRNAEKLVAAFRC